MVTRATPPEDALDSKRMPTTRTTPQEDALDSKKMPTTRTTPQEDALDFMEADNNPIVSSLQACNKDSKKDCPDKDKHEDIVRHEIQKKEGKANMVLLDSVSN